jgi:hypothetical protein
MPKLAIPFACLLLAAPAAAFQFIVNSPSDLPDHDLTDASCDVDPRPNVTTCTLRAAIQNANLTPGPHVIPLTSQTFLLRVSGAREDAAATGDLDILSDITIVGAGSTVIDAKGAKDRAFDVLPGGRLVLSDLSVLNGKTAKGDFDPGSASEVSGGCLRSAGALELDNVNVLRCASSDDGGCVAVLDGEATLVDTFIAGCKAKGEGGGLDVAAEAEVELDRVTVNACKAATGAGIATRGPLVLKNVTLDANKGKSGGGLAVLSDAPVTINSSTLSENGGSNLSMVVDAFIAGSVIVSNTIVWGRKGNDCGGGLVNAGGNLEGGTSCGFDLASDQQDADPELLPLSVQGDEVPTRPLAPTSPAIDRGLDASCEPQDARGKSRFNECDVGAFEFGR